MVDDVLKYVATNEIRWVDLQFFDIKGRLHRTSISNRKLDGDSFGTGVSESGLNELFSNNGSELLLLPDAETMARIPWEPATVRLICDLSTAISKERYLKDSRYIAERIETNFKAAGIKRVLVGSEVDCHLFDTVTADKTTKGRGTGMLLDSKEAKWGPSPLSNTKSGSFVPTPFDSLYAARVQISETMEDSFGMIVDSHKHGAGATAQQNFVLAERGLKSAADAMHTLRFVTRNLASAVNSSATFMPYPVEGQEPNSLGISMSLWKGSDMNLFYDGKEEYGQISQAGRYFIGGLLEHAPALSLFCSPIPNSYKRLAIKDFEVGWSISHKNALVRVPYGKKNMKEKRRLVYRGADPSANPHVAYAAIAAAGLDGIKRKIDPGDPVEKESGKRKRVKTELPSSLFEAIEALESDTKFIAGVVPREFMEDYLETKLKQHKRSLETIAGAGLVNYYNV